MSAAEAERDFSGEPASKTEAELLDVLYEVLAQGVPAGSKLTSGDVEQFLHEHARSKKSLEEMLAFFRRHGLPTEAYGADPELSSLASGLHRGRGPISVVMPLHSDEAPVIAPDESAPVRRAEPPADEIEESSTVRARTEAKRGSKLMRGVALGLGALSLCLAAGAYWGVRYGRELEQELKQARLQLQTTDLAVSSLEQRAERLREALSASESERQALSGKLERFVAEAQRERAVEDDVLKRMLGPRYQTLRAKLASEAEVQAASR